MDASEGNVMREEITPETHVRPSSVALWTGILAAPIAWAVDLQAKYALLQYVCRNHATWILWAITIVALLITAFGAFNAWRGLVLAGDDRRVQFMAYGGLAISAMFALSIIAAAIPDIFLKACD